ncbi:MAG: RNA-binding domain-containing protein [Candidatus Caldarchaeum sp.]
MFKLQKLVCRAHAYVTEDFEKVKAAVANVLQNTNFSAKKFLLEGHFGDPITVYECLLNDEEDVIEVFRKVVGSVGLSSVGIEEKQSSGGKIHIRIDKQKAFLGEFEAEDVDPIKLEFTYVGDWREAEKWLRSL